jgi:hypothetical protein
LTCALQAALDRLTADTAAEVAALQHDNAQRLRLAQAAADTAAEEAAAAMAALQLEHAATTAALRQQHASEMQSAQQAADAAAAQAAAAARAELDALKQAVREEVAALNASHAAEAEAAARAAADAAATAAASHAAELAAVNAAHEAATAAGNETAQKASAGHGTTGGCVFLLLFPPLLCRPQQMQRLSGRRSYSRRKRRAPRGSLRWKKTRERGSGGCRLISRLRRSRCTAPPQRTGLRWRPCSRGLRRWADGRRVLRQALPCALASLASCIRTLARTSPSPPSALSSALIV